jgi:hypothetical protein
VCRRWVAKPVGAEDGDATVEKDVDVDGPKSWVLGEKQWQWGREPVNGVDRPVV